jgi:hypothetical protein
MKTRWIRYLFLLASLYNLAIGCAVLLAYRQIFERMYGPSLTPIIHEGYIQFAAAMVAIFGVGFFFVAVDPVRNKDLIKLGVVYHLAPVFVVMNQLTHVAAQQPSTLGFYIPYAAINCVFAVFFAWVLWKLRGLKPAAE